MSALSWLIDALAPMIGPAQDVSRFGDHYEVGVCADFSQEPVTGEFPQILQAAPANLVEVFLTFTAAVAQPMSYAIIRDGTGRVADVIAMTEPQTATATTTLRFAVGRLRLRLR